jgi:hypothetical protein
MDRAEFERRIAAVAVAFARELAELIAARRIVELAPLGLAATTGQTPRLRRTRRKRG